ncbi:MAG: amidohydrolase [Halioglobus sp.]
MGIRLEKLLRVFIFGALFASPLAHSAGTKADLLITDAKVYTLEDEQPWAEAIAITGDEITYVGPLAQAQTLVGTSTQVIDANGGMVLPGFIDTHMHVGETIPYVFAAKLYPDQSPEEVLAALAAHAKAFPDQNPVIGSGFLGAAFGELGPTAKDLDRAIPDRPAIIFDEGFHSAWINSKAMEMVGLDADSQDPVPGSHYYKRYPDGTPTGWLIEGGAFEWVAQRLSPVTEEGLNAGADYFMHTLSSMGITAAFDAGMIAGGEPLLDLFERLDRAGKIPLRIVGSHYVNTLEHLPAALNRVQQLNERFQSEFFDMRMLKLSLDGTVEAQTAFMLDPYVKPAGHRASPLIPIPQAGDVVLEAARTHVDVHLHALGDAAVRAGLDMVERVRMEVPQSQSRFTMCHLQIVSPQDVQRFGELDVIAQSTPTWYSFDDLALESLGEERFEQMYPLASMAAGGARLTLGSDYPASWIGLNGLNPLYNIEMAMTRQPAGEPDFAVQPGKGERISLEQAIKAYTRDAAYQLRLENQVGTLKVGKQADIVVLSDNLFEIDRYSIHGARVTHTIANGQLVFSEGEGR